MWYNNIVETIGNTPLVRLNQVADGIKGTVLAKVEYMNPGHSIKDRIGLRMLEDAERAGKIKPGGTIVEGTSGNTGMGLALAAIAKGYKCVFTLSAKQSKAKVDILRAMGAEVIVCPNVPNDDPQHYHETAVRLGRELPNAYHINQYDNESNTLAHIESTGPEIWKQTEGRVTHVAAGMGTLGTITGISRYLKSVNPDVQIVGIDTFGSIFQKLHATGEIDMNEAYPYMTEGIGQDYLPAIGDMSAIDSIVKVSDKDGAFMARALSRQEGLFVGWSCGSAAHGALAYAREHLKEDDVMVIILPDHGSRYLGKIYDDEWMRAQGWMA